MSRLEWTEVTRLMLERVSPKAISRLERIIEEGTTKDALVAIKLILARTAPEPKVDSSANSRSLQFVSSESAEETAKMMEQMKKRIEAKSNDEDEQPEPEEPDQD
ncbi:MAG: hypothetical protein IKE60_26330 [Reyranella sp.]|uniref:hypothetical protein n=1 Tax=Reyranella sp. TaxID=1929291 RepID=UPI0025F6131E|nr:hypothetical protein [Reyranella sp.]MBR2818207.1 hypothetical protein [Reyranella sp.]